MEFNLFFPLSSDHGDDCITIRTAQLGFVAGCPNNEDVCCEHPVIKNPNVDKNCADDPDFHCVGIQVGKMKFSQTQCGSRCGYCAGKAHTQISYFRGTNTQRHSEKKKF